MKFAMLGTRGIPSSYSGFETAVEQLSVRMAANGHDVTVYCRSTHYKSRVTEYKGVRLVYLPTIPHKYLDTFIHTLLATLHLLLFVRPDVAYYFGVGNAPFTIIPRLLGIRSVLNVDGPDWVRKKWNGLGQRYLKYCERLACTFPHIAISDSKVVQKYYLDNYNQETTFIPYGAGVYPVPTTKTLELFGLEPRKYFLFVGRLVPENCAHHLVEAFAKMTTDHKLVIVGDAPYSEEYKASLRSLANENVVFTGYVFGDGYWELSSHADVFILTSEVGGTHPALVEAMGFENCVVVNATPANLETIGGAGFSYDGTAGADALRAVLEYLQDNPAVVEEYRRKAAQRVSEAYDWDGVTRKYEELAG